MLVQVKYLDKTGKILGYLLNNKFYTQGALVQQNIFPDNLVYLKSLRTFRSKPNSKIPEILVDVRMSAILYASLPPELKQYINNRGGLQSDMTGDAQHFLTFKYDNVPEYNKNTVLGYETINICRTLRNAVATNRLCIDKSKHTANDGNNIHLFNFIKACDYDIDSFLYLYFSFIQPFTLKLDTDNKQKDLIICYDTFYKFTMYIKYKKDTNVYIISFHESNKKRDIKASKVLLSKPNAVVLTDSLYPLQYKGQELVTSIHLSRGFLPLVLQIRGLLTSQDTIVVTSDSLMQELQCCVTAMMFNVLSEYADKDFAGKMISEVGNPLSALSLTSYGYTALNNLSLLVDIVPRLSKDARSLKAICEIFSLILSIEVTSEEQRNEFITVLNERYFSNTVDKDKNKYLLMLLNGYQG